MANVNIKFNNKDYKLSCDDGQEENLKQLAEHLDSKYNNLKKNLGNLGENCNFKGQARDLALSSHALALPVFPTDEK